MRNRTNTSEDSGAGSTRGTARGTRTAPRPSSRLGTSTTRPASRNGTSAKRQLYRENSAGGAKGTSRAGAVTRRPGTAMDQTTRRGQTSISTRTAPRRVGAGSSTSRSASAMGGGAGSVRSATSGKSRSTSTKRKQQAAAASGSTAAKTGPQFSAPRKLHKSGDEAETQASSLGSMLSSAADIRTFGTRDDVQEMELEFANTGFGIKLQYGVTINNKKYEAIVKEIRPGSPCAGKLLVGDRLVTIHGQDIKNTLFKEILQHVREASRKATQGIPQRLGFRLRPREAHAHAVAMGEEEALLVPTEYEDEIDITFNSTPLGLYFTGGRVTDVTRGSQVSEEVGVGDRLIKVDSTDLRLLDDHQIAQFLWDLINKISFTNPKTFTFLRKRRSGRHSAETDNATVRVTSTVQSPRSASRAGSVVSDGGRSAGGGGSALTPAALQRVVDLENSVPAGLPFAAAPNSAITFKVVFTAAPYYMQLQANPNGPGCHVRKVKRHSFASHYLRRYDVLIRVDGNDVTGWTVAEVCKYLETHIPTVDKPRVCVYQRFPRQARSVARSTTSFVTDATFFSPNANAQFNPNSFAAEIQAQQQAQVQRPVAKHGGGSSGAASDDGKSTTSGKGPGAAQDSDLSAAEKAQYRALSAHKTVHTTMEFARKSLREVRGGDMWTWAAMVCGPDTTWRIPAETGLPVVVLTSDVTDQCCTSQVSPSCCGFT